MSRGHMLRGVVLFGALSLAACIQKPADPGSGLPTSGIYKLGKPYLIDGAWHYPAEDFSYDETGIASSRGPDAGDRITANGEIHDEGELTAAHKTLPMPSLVRVTNLENGRSVVVRVNDRGPAANGRIIDLSRRGAQLLGFEPGGTAKVRVQILAEESRAIAAAARQGTPAAILAETEGPAPKAAPRGRVEVASAAGQTPASQSPAGGLTGAPVPPPSTVPGEVVGGRFVPAPVVTQLPVRGREAIFIHVGAFGSKESLARARSRLGAIGQHALISPAQVGRQKMQRVRVGPLDSVTRADIVLNQIIQAGLTDAKIVVE